MKIDKKNLWASIMIMLLVSMTAVTMIPMINVASASPDTHFYVDPPEVRDVSSPDTFLVSINVTDAPSSYAWEIHLSWDPDLLELVQIWDPCWEIWVGVMEGDFLDRRFYDDFWEEWVKMYETTFSYDSLVAANLEGEMRIGCSLKLDVPWASGDGWLCTLGFQVEAVGSCVLDLFDTRLWDYELAGSPAYTYHPNLDGFFYNTLFHDVAVDNVERNVTETWRGTHVGVNVTVTNEGNYTETSGTFNVTVYADITAYEYTYDSLGQLIKTTIVVGDEIVVGTQSVTEALAIGASATLDFSWDTTDVSGGNYTVSAELKGDDDTRDNLFIDGTVLIREHDLNVIGVGGPNVHVGENTSVSVTVSNEGTETEIFNINVYADLDTGVVGDEIIIGTIVGASLDAGAIDHFDINWTTTGVAEDIYTVSAYVPPVAGPPPEVDTADNTCIGGEVWVLFVSDIRGPENPSGSGLYPPDGVVDMWDFGFMGLAYGKTSADPDWENYEFADTRGPENPPGSGLFPPDGVVDMWDFGYCGLQYGQTIH